VLNRLGAVDVLRLASLLPELPRERTRLLDNLGRVRREVGPITMELSDALADHMNIRRGEVHEVVSFYSFLQVPADALRVCTGPVCDCFGARELLAGTPGAIEVACLGHCDLAPAMTRGDEIVPAVTHSTNDGPAVGLGAGDASLAEYEARGGVQLLRALPSLEQIVSELKASGLTGYGGAGFPTRTRGSRGRSRTGT
jgi:NADH:ubiquinone oxidoreductase subunit E